MTSTQSENLRRRIRERWHRYRGKSRHSSENPDAQLETSNKADDLVTGPTSTSDSKASETNLPLDLASGLGTATQDNSVRILPDQKTLHMDSLQYNAHAYRLTLENDIATDVSSDLWSAAYREAINRLGKDMDIAILQGRNVAQLFQELEDIDKNKTQESAFLRGVEYLRSIQVPLERFKLALDLASPLTSLEPTTSTVFGVVKSVSAIAISFATADLNFAKQIGQMLEQISYIDDCDTLGQKADKQDIHEALVLVYQKLLEFYKATLEILSREGVRLMIKMALETDRLPNIVQDFLSHADTLRKLVQKATWEVVEDIKSMLYDREIATWLGGDKMSRQSGYHASIQNLRANQACESLLEDIAFANWYGGPGSQRLVILGPMGYGKTFSMAFLIDELSRRNEHQLPKSKICYCYCSVDQSGLAVHVLSALTLSLLEQLPGLKKTFFEWYKQSQASGCFDPASNVQKLEEFFRQVLEAVDRPLFIVIDGLDECDSASQRRLLSFLESISKKYFRVKILISSRPDTEILDQLRGIPRIELGADPRRDRIIVERMVEKTLPNLSTDVKTLVIQTLSPLAQGSAIWTRTVVELIKVRKVRALEPMRRFLNKETLPTDLSKLYTALFLRCTAGDVENTQLVGIALALLTISRRPLSILELAWAVTLSISQDEVNTIASLSSMVDHERIMGLIYPFIGGIDFGDLRKHQVRLVHQSVKEFVIEGGGMDLARLLNSPTTVSKASIDQNLQSLETCCLNICVAYLLLEEIDHIDLFSEEQKAIEQLPQSVDLFGNYEGVEYDPHCSWETWEEDMLTYNPASRGFGEFFVYASCHWLDHFGAITKEPLPALKSIENLCQAGSARLNNWIEQNRRPGCTILPRFEFYSNIYDPLSITSLYGSEAMLHHMLENSDLDSQNFLSQPVLGAADQVLQWGDLARLRILCLEGNPSRQIPVFDIAQLTMKAWFYPRTPRDNWELAFDVVDHFLDTLIKKKLGNEVLCSAASLGCMPMIRRLMTRAQQETEVRTELLRGVNREQPHSAKSVHQSIGEAVLGNHVDVVEYLLNVKGIEEHLYHLNSRGENVLHLAATLCNPVMFHLLVPRFRQGLYQKDNQGNNVLARIAKSFSPPPDKYRSARILLSYDSADSSDAEGITHSEQRDLLQGALPLNDSDLDHLLVCIKEGLHVGDHTNV